MHQRLPLLDLLRGLALLGMIIFHGAYDLSTYWEFDLNVMQGGWWLLARATAILFLLISGMSTWIAEERLHDRSSIDRWKRRLRRTGLITLGAVAVSLVTYAMDERTYVRFGVLHLLAFSRVLLPLTKRLGWINGLLGIVVIVVGLQGPWTGSGEWLVPIGIVPAGFRSVDYFPLLPWLGVPLIGFGMMQGTSIRSMLSIAVPKNIVSTVLQTMGRHSLMIYLTHQPIVFAILWVLLGKPKNM